RRHLPDSVSFSFELQCSSVRRYQVTVTLDLQDRLIFVPSGILSDVRNCIDEFVEQLSEVASNQLAYLKWDGTSDLTTEYQVIRVLAGYQIQRSLMKFDIVMGAGSLIHLEELHNKKTIQL
ncbi:hypothetical protein ACKFKH_31595, partial [Phormidesmis sp. 146-20]